MRTTIGMARPCAAAVAAVVLVTTSCSGSGSAPTSNEIVILSGRDDSANGERAELVKSWNLSHDVKARIVEVSGSADQQHDEMIKEAQAPDSTVDVFNLDVTWTAEFADATYVTELDPLSDADAADFLPGPLQTAQYDGGLYALPFNTDAGLLYYDSSRVGCPETWEAIRAEVDQLRGQKQPRPEAVWAGQLRAYDGLVVNVLETLHALTLEKGDLFATPLPALQEAVDTLRPDPDRGPVLRDALDFDEQASVDALRQGKVEMLRAWPVARATLTAPRAEQPAPGTSATAPTVAVCQLPGNGAVLGGQNLAVSHRSTHPDEAAQLIRYLTSCDAERALFDQGGLAPTRRCAYETSRRASDEFTKTIEQAVQYATPRPQGPCYDRFSALFSRTVHDSLAKGTPLPPGFIDDLHRAIDCRAARY